MSHPKEYQKGKILIADPFLLGPVFERSVVLMADHSEVGAMGFILNQPTGFVVHQAVSELKGCNQKMYYGGPVDETLLFYVHTLGDKLPNAVEIDNGLYWGGEFDSLQKLNKKSELNAENIKFFIGYSGWEVNQLEKELAMASINVLNNLSKNIGLLSILNNDINDAISSYITGGGITNSTPTGSS